MNFASKGIFVFILALISPIFLIYFIWERIAFWKYVLIEKNDLACLKNHRDLTYFAIEGISGVVQSLPDMVHNDKYLDKYSNHILMAYYIAGALRDNYNYNRSDRKNIPIKIFGPSSNAFVKSDFIDKIKMIDVADYNEIRDEFLESLDVREAIRFVNRLVSDSLDRARKDRISDERSLAKVTSSQVS